MQLQRLIFPETPVHIPVYGTQYPPGSPVRRPII